MKPFIQFGSSIMIIVILISAVAFINRKNENPETHLEVVSRDLGHQHLHDFVSTKLPDHDTDLFNISFDEFAYSLPC